MIIIHAVFHVKPERREQFLTEVKPLIASSQTEEGNLAYELYEQSGQDNVFIMVETWRDAEAVAAHNASSHFTGFAGQAGEFLSAPLDVKVYNAEQVR
ncbi:MULTISPECIES: putative quinol monooxygenase [unclassified Paenibacillus]|uniref:putative quinol monooxygenase n=1 Tax=unclassified Paenibacillus TaxID=185978 RepID=UPI00369B1E80